MRPEAVTNAARFVCDADVPGRETIVRVTGGIKVKAGENGYSLWAAILAAKDVAARSPGTCHCGPPRQIARYGCSQRLAELVLPLSCVLWRYGFWSQASVSGTFVL